MHRLDTSLQRGASLGAFALPALALCLPSGYSYGAAMLLLCALVGLRRYPVWPSDTHGRWLMAAIVAMGALWFLEIDTQRVSSFEMPAKYTFALLCVGFVARFPPSPRAWMAGVLVGASASGLMAFVQMAAFARKRAHGFTNEIQFGNLSLLLGTMALAIALIHWRRWPWRWRLAAAAATVLGFLGSLLSQSRGGWLALVLLLPLCLWLAREQFNFRRSLGAVVAGVVLLVLGALPFRATLSERFAEAGNEIHAYQTTGDANTSVGQRLAHWRLAWDMGTDRPLLGWGGKAGYEKEKIRRVEAGSYPPVLLNFTHAHNELLDAFAKRGLVGVTGLVLFYAIPLWIFWPTRRRMARCAGEQAQVTELTVRSCAVLLSASYVGFGWTQAFFSHNSGNMFYLFPLIALYGMLQGLRVRGQTARPPGRR